MPIVVLLHVKTVMLTFLTSVFLLLPAFVFLLWVDGTVKTRKDVLVGLAFSFFGLCLVTLLR